MEETQYITTRIGMIDALPSQKQITDELYILAAQKVKDIINYFHPSGCERCEGAMSKAITNALEKLGLTETKYWNEVARRAPAIKEQWKREAGGVGNTKEYIPNPVSEPLSESYRP